MNWTRRGISVPCSHRYSLGVATPTLPQGFDIVATATWLRCVPDHVKISREAPEGTLTSLTSLKNLAVKNIEQFSRSRSSKKIKRYVEENFVFGGEFVHGFPISVLDMISSRIKHFKT
jgi:hypothetical protein